MKREDYINTTVMNGHMVNIGMDDYGQCFYIEYINEDGELEEETCGTYNTEVDDYIKYKFDPTYREQVNKELGLVK